MRRAILLSAAVGLLGPPARAADAPPSLDVGPTVEALRDFARTCEAEGRALWGEPLCAPVLVVEPTTRLYVASHRPGGGEGEGPFVGVLPPEVGIANTAREWAGTVWVQLRGPLPASPLRRRAVLRHEAFHALQKRRGFTPQDLPNLHLDTEEGRWLLGLEWRALGRALVARGPARREAVADALAFRAARRARFPEAAREEAALERNEALAEYTGTALGGRTPAERRTLAQAFLDEGARAPTFVRSFAYATGPAYGVLLDEAGARWRQEAFDGAPLEVLLGRAYRVEAPAGDVEARARRHGGEALRAEEAARAQRKAARVAQLEALLVHGPVLRLPLEQMQIDLDPTDVVPLGPHGTVYPGARIRDRWGRLASTGPVLVGADWRSAAVPAPASPGGPLQGERWSLELTDGWSTRAGGRPGDLELVRMKSP